MVLGVIVTGLGSHEVSPSGTLGEKKAENKS